MKNKRDLFGDNVQLIEPGHKYLVRNYEHLAFTSATTFIEHFFEGFDAKKVAGELANSNNKNWGHLSEEEILEDWKESGTTGTLIHKEIEAWTEDRDFEPTHVKSKHGIAWLVENLEPHFKVYSEVKIFSLRLQLAGTIDMLIYDPTKNLWIIADWKSNKRIYTSSFDKKTGTHRATMYLPDCNYYHYSLQMSLYQWILENEYDINIYDRILLHLKEAPTAKFPLGVQEYSIEYLGPNIEKMIAYREWEKSKGLFKLSNEIL